MFRFDLLDEFTSIAAPRVSQAHERHLDHDEVEADTTSGNWRYAVTGVVAILAVTILAL